MAVAVPSSQLMFPGLKGTTAQMPYVAMQDVDKRPTDLSCSRDGLFSTLRGPFISQFTYQPLIHIMSPGLVCARTSGLKLGLKLGLIVTQAAAPHGINTADFCFVNTPAFRRNRSIHTPRNKAIFSDSIGKSDATSYPKICSSNNINK